MESTEINSTNINQENNSEPKQAAEAEISKVDSQKSDETVKVSEPTVETIEETISEAVAEVKEAETVELSPSEDSSANINEVVSEDTMPVDPVTASVIAATSLGLLNQYGASSDEEVDDNEDVDKNKEQTNEARSYLDKIVSAQNYRIADSDE